MSLPEFPKPDTILTRDQALDAILTSIAMEEVALSHIINAEGEKIQYILKAAKECKADICDVIEVNDSVSSLLEQVNDMQITLKNKLRWALKYLPRPEEPPCPEPRPPWLRPKPPCPGPRPPWSGSKPPCPGSRPPWSGSKPPCPGPRPPWSSSKTPCPGSKPPCSCLKPRSPWLSSPQRPKSSCSCLESKSCSCQNPSFLD